MGDEISHNGIYKAMKPILRDDDIYLSESPTDGALFYDLEKFKAVHEIIAKSGNKHMLAINSAEMNNYTDLTWYIQSRKHEFDFGIHGWGHEKYSTWPKDAIVRSFGRAKEYIEGMFDVKVEWYFPTWNKRSPEMYEACKELGLRLDDVWMNLDQALAGEQKETICFHYWNDHEVELLKLYLSTPRT
jgi:peptidoglycan/xylan/chitin deacetylase (PgdA/CDA1 family)